MPNSEALLAMLTVFSTATVVYLCNLRAFLKVLTGE
jgi:hypothetical protein